MPYRYVLINFQRIKQCNSPFSIAITSLEEERANFSVFCTFVRYALVWFCLFPVPLGRAVVCDCGTPWTFLLPFLTIVFTQIILTPTQQANDIKQRCINVDATS